MDVSHCDELPGDSNWLKRLRILNEQLETVSGSGG